VPALIAALEDLDQNVRAFAAETLGEIGPQAKVAVTALERALEDKNFVVSSAAKGALFKIRYASK
jgi:HEAT repeat protein